jgi:soluble lytic murein transglycosylase
MAETPELVALATTAAQAAGVPVDLFLGLIKTESDWNPGIRSRSGALGLSQVMPIWATERYAASIGMTGISPADLLRPDVNLRAGSRILAQELQRFGRPELAAMAYNAGAGVVTRAIQQAGTDDPATVSNQLPAAETRAYWQKVQNWASVYANKLSALQATAENVATDVGEGVKGNVAPIMLGVIVLLGIIVWVRR